MIPLQLTLRNFLSYRDAAELDLTGVHLACISGLNGVGKSSILEAITWSLFGKSRVKSGDDDVVNRSAAADGAAAEVSFIFELEGTIYRVIRRKAVGKTTELEFNARMPGADGDWRAGSWRVLTEARIRDTQAEIEKLLRMSYDVFTNASFLLQGRADEFTTKQPGQRKEILADILGVSIWDEYKDMAADHRKGAEAEARDLDRRIEEVEAELAQEEEYVQALEKAEMLVATVSAERDKQDALVAVARQNQTLAEQQREMLRRATDELTGLEGELERNESVAAQRRAALTGYRALLDRREAIMTAYEAWQQVNVEFSGWQAKAEEQAAINRQTHPLELVITRAESELQQRVRELENQRAAAERATAELAIIQTRLTGNEARCREIQTRLAELEAQQAEWQTVRDRLQALEFERKEQERDFVQLQSRAGEIATLEGEREQVDTSLRTNSASLEEAQRNLRELAEKREMLEGKKRKKASIEGEIGPLRIEMNFIKARMKEMESGDVEDCPLCGQAMTGEHQDHAIQEYKRQGTERGDRFREITAALETLNREIAEFSLAVEGQKDWERKRDTAQAAVSRIEERLKSIDRTLTAWREGDEEAKLAELEQKMADESEAAELKARAAQLQSAADETRQLNQALRQVEAEITGDRTRCEGLERTRDEWEARGRAALEAAQGQLEGREFAPAEQAALADLKSRLAAVAYDAAAHAAARARLQELAAAPEEHQRLQQAEAAVKPLADGLADLDRQREKDTARAAELRIQREQGRLQLQTLEAGIGDLPAAELELQRLREEAVAAMRAEGAARQRVEVLAVRRQDRKTLGAEKTALMHRLSLLRQLEEACGRKGVQVMLIDAALPEIEAYANELLFRLSGGDMNIKFETQRASKSKQDNVIETLDIIIGDSFGVRPYENYSGGEKFRVNFAIRLALSQVLARRAGARLRTLVIDEGFGSQDPEGRQRLVEAINAVQDEFACILVITHIDELRDKFPTRIDVEKTPAGSRLSLVTI